MTHKHIIIGRSVSRSVARSVWHTSTLLYRSQSSYLNSSQYYVTYNINIMHCFTIKYLATWEYTGHTSFVCMTSYSTHQVYQSKNGYRSLSWSPSRIAWPEEISNSASKMGCKIWQKAKWAQRPSGLLQVGGSHAMKLPKWTIILILLVSHIFECKTPAETLNARHQLKFGMHESTKMPSYTSAREILYTL